MSAYNHVHIKYHSESDSVSFCKSCDQRTFVLFSTNGISKKYNRILLAEITFQKKKLYTFPQLKAPLIEYGCLLNLEHTETRSPKYHITVASSFFVLNDEYFF